jgi:hypothetical protein
LEKTPKMAKIAYQNGSFFHLEKGTLKTVQFWL